MDEDTIIELKVVRKAENGDPVTNSLPTPYTLGQLRDWLQENLDFPEPEGE